METDKALSELRSTYQHKDWFADVGTDPFGRVVVYVSRMNYETLHDIPDYVGDKQVVVHFNASNKATREQFTNQIGPIYKTPIVEPEEELTALQHALDELELICGSHNLQDIFYEIHDQNNAITDVSSKYPKVREVMEILFDQYGFDVIYEELEQFETLPEYTEE